MTNNLSRRQLAKGAAWSVPAIAVASSVPAMAASNDTYGATVCNLFYGSGTINNQTHSIHLGVYTNADATTIPAGTKFTWTVTLGTSGSAVPTTNYSPNNRWTLTTSPSSGTRATSFTVTMTINTEVPVSEVNCVGQLIWNDTYVIRPKTPVTVAGGASVPTGQGNGVTSSLSYTVAKRHPSNTNQSGRAAHHYTAKAGAQNCYPAIQYSLLGPSQRKNCGDGGNDTSTIYPDGTCDMIVATASEVGNTQKSISQKC